MKQWHAFISHAFEDKSAVAVPLCEALTSKGARIWLDKHELRIGDSLREKIDQGLTSSRYGIVIISPSFFSKDWPKRELEGLFALEDSGKKRILPVWHNVDQRTVAMHFPTLAGRLAGNWSDGIEQVSRQLLNVILDPSVGVVTSGLIDFKGLTFDHPLKHMQTAITGGVVQRDEQGKLRATLKTFSAIREFQEFAERLGIDTLQMVSEESSLSDDPAKPTTFRGEHSVKVSRGERLLEIMTWKHVIVPFDMTMRTAYVAQGVLLDGKFVGRYGSSYVLLETGQRFDLSGSFEVQLE